MMKFTWSGFMILAAISLNAASAHAWEKIIECDGGNFVVDQQYNNWSHNMEYQMVVRGPSLDYFISKGTLRKEHINSKGELVRPLTPSKDYLVNTITSGGGDYFNFTIVKDFQNHAMKLETTYVYNYGITYMNWIYRSCWWK